MRAIHLVGLGHSGTTIIERLLACLDGVIGLGEVDKIWRRLSRGAMQPRHRCPCGATASSCVYWGSLMSLGDGSRIDFLRSAVAKAQALGARVVVDSSKKSLNAGHYLALVGDGDLQDVTLVRIVRDPRGWVASMLNRYGVDRSDLNLVRGYFYVWLFDSLALDQKTRSLDGETVYVWYDRLVVGEEIDALGKRLGLPLLCGPLDLNTANQHAIAGSKSNYRKGSKELRYDRSWLEEEALEKIYQELPFVGSYYQKAQSLHLAAKARMEIGPQVEKLPTAMILDQAARGDFSWLKTLAESIDVHASVDANGRDHDAAAHGVAVTGN